MKIIKTTKIKSIFMTLLSMMILLLTACTVEKKSFEDKQILWKQNQARLKKIKAFNASGSLSYFDYRTRNYGRILLLQEAPNHYTIKLTTPFGGSLFSINVTQKQATYIDSKGNTITDVSAQNLVERITGMTLPLDTVQEWLLGISRKVDDWQLNNDGQLVSAQLNSGNSRWMMSVKSFTKANNNKIILPKQIELKNTDQDIRIVLGLTNWTIQ